MGDRPRLLDPPRGHRCVIDDDDLALVADRNWYVTANGYVACMHRDSTGKRRMVLMHRLITAAPTGTHVDHINGVKTDNRRSNLRVVHPSINQANRKRLNRNNSSGVRGVAPSAASSVRPWRAQITVMRRNVHLGLFATKEEAVAARRSAELLYFGEVCP